jgi:hypothetical protein
MLTADTSHCKTLEEFYESIRSQQEKYHGEHYCAHHDAVKRCLQECDTYKELGLHQGASAASGILCNPKKVELIDITLEKYNWSKDLFQKYCSDHKIELIVKECSSIDKKSLSPTQVLLIDSLHRPEYLTQELRFHQEYVSDYIVFHDTSQLARQPNEALYYVIEKFCKELNQWEIVERETRNAGYTVIKKMK